MSLQHTLFPGLVLVCLVGCAPAHTHFALRAWYDPPSESSWIEVADAGGIAHIEIQGGQKTWWECGFRKEGYPTSYTWKLNLPDGSYRLKVRDKNGEKWEWPIVIRGGEVSPVWVGCL